MQVCYTVKCEFTRIKIHEIGNHETGLSYTTGNEIDNKIISVPFRTFQCCRLKDENWKSRSLSPSYTLELECMVLFVIIIWILLNHKQNFVTNTRSCGVLINRGSSRRNGRFWDKPMDGSFFFFCLQLQCRTEFFPVDFITENNVVRNQSWRCMPYADFIELRNKIGKIGWEYKFCCLMRKLSFLISLFIIKLSAPMSTSMLAFWRLWGSFRIPQSAIYAPVGPMLQVDISGFSWNSQINVYHIST